MWQWTHTLWENCWIYIYEWIIVNVEIKYIIGQSFALNCTQSIKLTCVHNGCDRLSHTFLKLVHLRITCSIKEFEKSSQAIPLPPISCNVPFCPENEKKNAFINLKKKKKKRKKTHSCHGSPVFFFFFLIIFVRVFLSFLEWRVYIAIFW
jgi:hypothetical protein